MAQALRNLPPTLLGRGLQIIAGVGAAAYAVNESIYTVEGGHRAVIFNRITGVRQQVVGEGTHFLIPFIEWPTIFDIRTKPVNIPSLTGTKDLQMVNLTLRILYAPHREQLPKILQTLGTDYDERVLPSISNEVMKSVVAQFTASQLITQREQVSRLIRRRLIERARDFDLELSDVSLTHLSFSREYSNAVESKQVAQQEAERARFLVERALQDKKAAIVRATGEAQSARLIGSALAKNSSFLELRRIEAAREIASVISQSSNKVFLNSDALLVNLAARSPVVAGHEDNVAAAIIDAAAKAGHEDNVAAAIVQAGKANASPAGATKPVEAAQKK